MNEIPGDEAIYKKCVQKVQLRMLRSAAWSINRRAEWVRFYKYWRKVVDYVPDPEEPNITLGYIFGLVEQINSKVTEPLLAMGIPFGVFPRHDGDADLAENFAQVCRSFYAQPNQQEALRRSKKEMLICGPRWEIDGFLNIERKGKMWGMVPRPTMTQATRLDGTPLTKKNGQPVMIRTVVPVPGEVAITRKTHYGFVTRYPSVFDMYPEPDRKTIGTGAPTDCSWLVEDLGDLAIEDMCREVYLDPRDKMTKPVYDFSRMVADRGRKAVERYDRIMKGADVVEDSYGPLIVPSGKWNMNTDYSQIDKDTQYPSGGKVNRQSTEDRDKAWFVRHYQGDEILTIANGKYVVQRVKDPWHVPGIKARVENYTQDPEFLYGQGIIQPIEDEVIALGDSFNLSFSNAIRLVNKMVAVREDAIVNFEDFKPSAGGKIRISGATDVRQAIAEVEQGTVINEMLAMDSSLKGEIEFVSSNLDGAPGVQGTKANHKTKGGLELIQVNMNTRFITMQAQALINEARRGLSMEEIFSQFAFEKRPYRVYRDDGSTGLSEFNKDDVFTEGRGFDFVIELDPLWGNSNAQRQDSLAVFESMMEYEKFRREAQDPTMPKANLGKGFENVLKKFGYRDLSKLFTMPDNSMTPETELKIIMNGGVVECNGDLIHHAQTHLAQAASPKIIEAVKAGKVSPDTVKNLQMLTEQCLAKIRTFAKDPMGSTQERLNQAGMSHPGVPE